MSSSAEVAETEDRQRALLVSFAMLQGRFDERSQGYLDQFEPFVSQCAKDHSAQAFEPQDIQVAVRTRFGLAIPSNVVGTTLKRGVRKGLYQRSGHRFSRVESSLADVDLEPARRRGLRTYEGLLAKLVDFARQTQGLELDDTAVDDAFLKFITDRSLPIARAALLGEDLQLGGRSGDQLTLLLASFVIHLATSDVQGFDDLDAIVRGCLIATSVYLPDPSDLARRVKDLSVYLDTPLVVSALNWHGEAKRDATLELIKVLQDLGVTVACFNHTVDEVENLLLSCSQQMHSRSQPGSSLDIVVHARSMGFGPSDLQMAAHGVVEDLGRLDIQFRNAPDYTIRGSVDEALLEEQLQESVHYLRPETRLYDVKSLTAVWRIRGGQRQRDFETARAILTTSNPRVVEGSHRFFQERPNGLDVPICALDSELATVAWLKRPAAAPDLPRKQIVADCLAALDPGDAYWKQFLAIVDDLNSKGGVTEEDYATLRYTVEARRALAEVTLLTPEALSAESVTAVLRNARSRQHSDLAEEVAVANLRAEKAEASEDQLAQLNRESTGEVEELRRRLAEERDSRGAQIDNLAFKYARTLAKVAYWLIVAILLGWAFTFSDWGLSPHPISTLVGAALFIFWIVGGVISLGSVLGGKTVHQWIDRLERMMAVAISRGFRSRLEGGSNASEQ